MFDFKEILYSSYHRHMKIFKDENMHVFHACILHLHGSNDKEFKILMIVFPSIVYIRHDLPYSAVNTEINTKGFIPSISFMMQIYKAI